MNESIKLLGVFKLSKGDTLPGGKTVLEVGDGPWVILSDTSYLWIQSVIEGGIEVKCTPFRLTSFVPSEDPPGGFVDSCGNSY